MHLAKPTLVGAAMALGMLALMHDAIMAGTANATWGAFVFVLLHGVALVILSLLILLVPKARRFIRSHRPDRVHVAAMMTGMLVAAGSVHLIVHGVS